MIKYWEEVKLEFEKILADNPNTTEELENLFLQRSKLLAMIDEDLAWRYINMTRYTQNTEYVKNYNDFIENIQPNVILFTQQLNKKLIKHSKINYLEKKYYTAIRKIRKEVELFNEKNIPLITKEDKLSQEFAQITGVMTIRCEGKELTLQQASSDFDRINC